MVDDFWRECAHCETEYSSAAPPPVVELVTDDGERYPISFCCEECWAAWQND